jgi:hypothetical protein
MLYREIAPAGLPLTNDKDESSKLTLINTLMLKMRKKRLLLLLMIEDLIWFYIFDQSSA